MAKSKKTNPKEMSFLQHLEELRWILIRCAVVILITSCVAFTFSDFIYKEILFGPKDPNFFTYKFFCSIAQTFGAGDTSICNADMPFKIQNTSMGGQVSFMIWTCITAGFILAVPYVFWELWRFISPALYQKERNYARGFISVSSLLFFTGVLFGYYFIVPLSVYFFGTFSASPEIVNEFNLESYTSMIKTSVLGCGVMFELPILIFFLTKMGLVTPESLRKYRKFAIVIVLIVAAIITPPDVVSQTIVSIPIMLLYEISIWISVLITKKEKKALENG